MMKKKVFLVLATILLISTTGCFRDNENELESKLVTTIVGQVFKEDGSPFTEKCWVHIQHIPSRLETVIEIEVRTDSRGKYKIELEGEFVWGITWMNAYGESDIKGYRMKAHREIILEEYEINNEDFILHYENDCINCI